MTLILLMAGTFYISSCLTGVNIIMEHTQYYMAISFV